ncbi:MAG: VWA domain-containing protein [Flavobacteriales bacterium]|nr:VWA domain-containing protein [Flavobacteriales bacterium]
MNRPNAHLHSYRRHWGIIDPDKTMTLAASPLPARTLGLVLSLALALGGVAQEPKKPMTRVLFVFDGSNSMNAFWGDKPKINTAREVMERAMKEVTGAPDLEMALRVYGHQTPIAPGKQDCDDTKLEVPFGPNNEQAILRTLNGIRCLGTTPIARSLEKAAGDFPECRNCRNIIILITDGIEACDEDPCAVSRALQAKGIILKPFVIGVGIEDAGKYSLQCVGNYYDATSPEMFDHVMKMVITQALNTTTAQVDLRAADGKPTETNVPVTLYDQRTGSIRYHFTHTLNGRGLPDTLLIDPVYTYRMVVHTIPPEEKENIKLRPGEHNTITIEAAQGILEVRMPGGDPASASTPVIVRRTGASGTLHVQSLNSSERYRLGRYDLEILTLPRTLVGDVVVKQGAPTLVQVPRPGILSLQFSTPGHGAVFLKEGSTLRWVTNWESNVTNVLYKLQPGDYRVTYRSVNARQTVYSVDKDLSIQSDRSITLTF